ncbi:MAG TPA: thiol reductant ABC exporter subunit CydC [Planococcus sp. (in: firmicutes)]|nr:thiol reductant ABC exporter subunit CydC [Planococcus sp. (in: firmicutes)]
MSGLKQMLFLTFREKRDVALAVFFGFLAGVAGVALLASSGYLISRAALTSQMTILIIMGACLKLFGLASALSRYAERLFSHRATFTMLSNLRTSFFGKLSPLAPGIFSQYRSGDLLARIVGDVESLQNFLLRVLYPPVVLLLVFLSTIFFSAYFSIGIAAVIAAGAFLTVFAIPAVFALRQRTINNAARASRAALSTESAELLYGFRDLKIHQRLEQKQQLLENFSGYYVDEKRKEGLEENLSQSVNGLAALLTSFFVLGLGAYFVASGELDGLYLAMLVMISLGAFENVSPMAAFPAHFEENRKAASRLDEVAPVAPSSKGKELPPLWPFDITLNSVSFTYGGEERAALSDISLHIAAGTKTAIVGPSGSGKSTLIQLLLNIVEPSKGTIQLGGRELGTLDQEEVWKSMNAVLQENHFFFGTIKSNLLIANELASDEQLEAALSQVQLDELALSMKVGERGQNLSGGQKQRLAIARAILRRKPLWLLDEPVSSVDGVTAQAIYSELFSRGKGESFIIVSHDLAALSQVDQIIVMDGGRIAESGTYSDLMRKKAYFYELKQIERDVFA